MDRKKATALRGGIKYIIFLLAVGVVLTLLPRDEAQAASQVVKVGTPVLERPELFLHRSMPVEGEGKVAVFLIDFPDERNNNPVATVEYYDGVYFSGTTETNWGMTVADYYREQSFGKLNLSGRVFDWYTARHEKSYYDDRKPELVMEAAEYYASQGVDFSEFDGDGDGIIDAVAYHFAGEYSTVQGDSWYYGVEYGASGSFGSVSGVGISNFVQIYENASNGFNKLIEVICHELMHCLGMHDLYNTTNIGIDCTTDLMSSNDYVINPYTKILLGWIDTVTVVDDPTKGVRLGLCEDTGDVAIVTDDFSGFFDEFYLVAYRRYSDTTLTAVIWHIDARTVESGTAFKYNNLSYLPRPDRGAAHQDHSSNSTYLFIEELSADPAFDFVLNRRYSLEQTAFVEDSVLGPNSMPSSDGHDGNYTGIRIDNFVEHNDQYLTFDVSFVTDTAAPVVSTKEDELEFKETVKLHFNEYIYPGSASKDIKVTDLEGKELDASIVFVHYPRNEIEITFKDSSYENGYKIVLPKGCVKDSSGNDFAGATLTASKEGYLFPASTVQLPGTGDYLRRNDGLGVFFFNNADHLTVITPLWENHVSEAKLEIMRLDYDGNVLSQKIIDNPFVQSTINTVLQTGNGDYIAFYVPKDSFWISCLLCFDAEGNVKWARNDYGTDINFAPYRSSNMTSGDGLIVNLQVRYPSFRQRPVYIDPANGNITELEGGLFASGFTYQFPNGDRLMQFTPWGEETASTFQLLATNGIDTTAIKAGTSIEGNLEVLQLSPNSDGTFLLNYLLDGFAHVTLFDAELNALKTVTLSPISTGGNELNFIRDDGFCEALRVYAEGHANSQYHVRRYDRYLNLLWETDVIANFVYYFKSPSGEVLAYRSMYEPERECYIDSYGSEDAFKTVHVHTLIRRAAVSATCNTEGIKEHWYCSECGVLFLDKNGSAVADADALRLPLSEDHDFGQWVRKRNPTYYTSGEEVRSCKTCGLEERRTVPPIPIPQTTAPQTTAPQTTAPQTTAPQTTVATTTEPQTTTPPTTEPATSPSTLPPELPMTAEAMSRGLLHGLFVYLNALNP